MPVFLNRTDSSDANEENAQQLPLLPCVLTLDTRLWFLKSYALGRVDVNSFRSVELIVLIVILLSFNNKYPLMLFAAYLLVDVMVNVVV